MIIVTVLLFSAPAGLLVAAWRGYLRHGSTSVTRWRSYLGASALSLASLATALELVFFFSWFHNGGSPHGLGPAPGIWKYVGRIAFGIFLSTIPAALLGKGRWRVLFSAWAASLCMVVPAIFVLHFD